jgi:hypothetical protein
VLVARIPQAKRVIVRGATLHRANVPLARVVRRMWPGGAQPVTAAPFMLYAGPFRLDRPPTIRAKAIRYGYKESPETRTVFTAAGARR